MFNQLVRAIALIFFLILLGSIFIMPAFAATNQVSGISAHLKAENDQSTTDLRPVALKSYLEKRNSPLADYADAFIATADKYELDWKLVPAISGLESAFAKRYVAGTYNAYGWGGGYIYFTSWEDSIETVSAALKAKYIDRGAKTVNQIGRIYAPPNPAWGSLVNHLMTEIDKEYQTQTALTLSL